jgi:hypothetical protein
MAVERGDYMAVAEDGERLFQYRSENDRILRSWLACDVRVTSLEFIPALGALAVGYNFGAFQLWRIDNVTLM